MIHIQCHGHIDPVLGRYTATYVVEHKLTETDAQRLLEALTTEDYEDAPRCLLDVLGEL